MPLPVISNGFRVRSIFSNVEGGRPWSTGMDFLATTPGGTAQALADAVGVEWGDFFTVSSSGSVPGTFFRDEVKLQEVQCYALDGTTAPASYTPAVAPGGTQTAQTALPPDIAVVVSKRTAVRGARGRGRAYLGGLAVNAMSSLQFGLFSSNFSTSIETAYAFSFDTITTGGITYKGVVIGRIASGSPIQAAYRVTDYLVDQSPDVQRRRGLA